MSRMSSLVATTLDPAKLPTHWPDPQSIARQEKIDLHGKYSYNGMRLKLRELLSAHRHEVDTVVGTIITINLIIVLVQLQWSSLVLAHKLGLREDDGNWGSAQSFFQKLDYAFLSIYLVELTLRIWALGKSYFHSWMNVFDAAVVMINVVEIATLHFKEPISSGVDTGLGRLLRLVRLFRVLKFMRALRFGLEFQGLRIMLRTLRRSMVSLFWSIVLIFGIIIACAALLAQLTAGYVQDDSKDETSREAVYHFFGSPSRASYTMFESTFTTIWVNRARLLMEDVHGAFAIFWIPFVLLTNFAVVRVAAALFVKETLRVASEDEENVAMSRLKSKAKLARQLHQLFAQGDTDGSGTITVDEFNTMLYNPRVGAMFQDLDLEVLDVATLFMVMSEDDGSLDYEEFLRGVLKVKNTAKFVDVIQILHEQIKTRNHMEYILKSLDHIRQELGLHVPAPTP